jgi:hypothetical protein
MCGRVTVALLAALLPMVTACGNSGSTQSKGSTGPVVEWKRYSPAGAGYTVELPAVWQTVDTSSIASAGGIDQYTRDHPEIDMDLRQFSRFVHSSPTLMGIEGSLPDGGSVSQTDFAANILVIQVDLHSSAGDPALLEQVLNFDEKNAEGLPGGDQHPLVTLFRMSGLSAGSVRYHQLLSTGAAVSSRITELDNVVVKDGIGYGVYCTSTTEDFDRISSVCDHAVSSFRLGG